MKKNNKKFSFVKWLTNRDIEKLVEAFGCELMDKENCIGKQNITRVKDEDGYNHILVYCIDTVAIEAKNIIKGFFRKNSEFRDMMLDLDLMLIALNNGAPPRYSVDDFYIMTIDITDFFVFGERVFDQNDNQKARNAEMTDIYQKYMTKKFGRFYTGMKSAEYKRVKQAKEEEQKEAEKANEAEEVKEN